MNILLTSVGRRTYMVHYFQKALCGDGMVHASNSEMTYTMLQADKYVITPKIYDSGYIDFLLEYCKGNNISAILPLFDIDLPVLSKNKELFKENGIKVVVSNYEAIRVCNDKYLTYSFFKEIGLRVIPTFLSLKKVFQALHENKISFPVILKPRWGMGSIGIYEAENEDELEVFYAKLKREIFQTYLRYESQESIDSCVIIQEKISGKEYGCDVLNDFNKQYVGTVAKQKKAMRAGETDIAEIVDSSIFEPVTRLISKRLGHIANLDVDCFVTDSNEIYVLEMNCRFGGQYPFSHLSGVDFPKQILLWLEGKGTDPELVTPKIGIKGCKDIVPRIMDL
ncbi:MAG: ATP-grasp domain-containing protein [Bacteroidales bacterium]